MNNKKTSSKREKKEPKQSKVKKEIILPEEELKLISRKRKKTPLEALNKEINNNKNNILPENNINFVFPEVKEKENNLITPITFEISPSKKVTKDHLKIEEIETAENLAKEITAKVKKERKSRTKKSKDLTIQNYQSINNNLSTSSNINTFNNHGITSTSTFDGKKLL